MTRAVPGAGAGPLALEGTGMNPSLQELRRQRLQIDAQRDAGTLDEAAHAKARAEIDRRLVDAVMAPAPSRKMPWTLIGFGVAGALAVTGIYLGATPPSPSASGPSSVAALPPPPGPAPGAAPHALEAERMSGAIDALRARLESRPDDAAGWAMLARTYTVLGRPADALPAYRKAEGLSPDDPVLLADYADALAMSQGRRLAGEPMKLVQRALALDPDNLKALSLAGTDAFDRQDWPGALAHWERLQALAPAGNPLAAQIKDGVAEARRRAGLPAGPTATPAVAAAAARDPAPTAAGARVAGTVTLAPALAAQAAPDDTVFIFARAAQGPRMPLAVLRRQVRDLPIDFSLDDSMAMSPAARLSTATQVVVGARVSKSGQAMSQPGDLLGETAAVAPGRADLRIEIDRVVPR